MKMVPVSRGKSKKKTTPAMAEYAPERRKKPQKHKKKKKKSIWRNALEEVWDVVEDVFD